MKHLRQRNYLELFQTVQNETQIQLEHPLLTVLHKELVLDGNFDKAEEILVESLQNGFFQEYLSSLKYKPIWKRIAPKLNAPKPGHRGGHQMCIDSNDGVVYLMGGWDGSSDLSDFWSYHESTGEWQCISMDTRKEKGPDPRSCHKVCFDPQDKVLYTLGKYVDPDSRPNTELDSDFWKYEVRNDRWIRISSNTAAEGGPELIYDHQMVLDSQSRHLYVYGGRKISPDPTQITYSGLYRYSILEKKWTHLTANTQENSEIKPRIGHSMLFNEKSREIYIFAGQRHKDFLADFHVYNVEAGNFSEWTRDYSKIGGK